MSTEGIAARVWAHAPACYLEFCAHVRFCHKQCHVVQGGPENLRFHHPDWDEQPNEMARGHSTTYSKKYPTWHFRICLSCGPKSSMFFQCSQQAFRYQDLRIPSRVSYSVLANELRCRLSIIGLSTRKARIGCGARQRK